jgi:protein CpxP
MTRLNSTRLTFAVLLAGTTLAALVPAQAQPMTGEMGMYQNEGYMHQRLVKHWEQHLTEMKTKLHLAGEQEQAWTAYVQGMKVPTKRLANSFDQEELAKLSTPERMEKMNAVHEANIAIMQTHMKQRTEATRLFYNQLSAEQQKVFDAETLSEHSRWKGKLN